MCVRFEFYCVEPFITDRVATVVHIWLEKRCIGWGREWNSFYLFVQMHGIWREWKWKKRIIVNYISLYRWVFTLSSIICDHLIWLAPDTVQLAYFEQNTVIMMNNFGWFIYIILLNIVLIIVFFQFHLHIQMSNNNNNSNRNTIRLTIQIDWNLTHFRVFHFKVKRLSFYNLVASASIWIPWWFLLKPIHLKFISKH